MKRVAVSGGGGNVISGSDDLFNDVTRQLDVNLRRLGLGTTGSSSKFFSSFGSSDPQNNEEEEDLISRVLGKNPLMRTSRKHDSFPQDASSVERPFSVSFDLQNFEARDISITFQDGILTVSARHEERQEEAKAIKQFNRKVKMPSYLNPEDLSSTFKDGVLTVESISKLNDSKDDDEKKNCSHTKESPGKSVALEYSDTWASGSLPLDIPFFSGEGSDRKMQLVVELGVQYQPEDVLVRMGGNKKIIVKANHTTEEKQKKSRIKIEREFILSEPVDESSVEAMLKHGKLIVSGLVESQGGEVVVVRDDS